MINHNIEAIQAPINSAEPEIQTIVTRVLAIEKAKLYAKNPRNINDDILQVIKDVIR